MEPQCVDVMQQQYVPCPDDACDRCQQYGAPCRAVEWLRLAELESSANMWRRVRPLWNSALLQDLMTAAAGRNGATVVPYVRKLATLLAAIQVDRVMDSLARLDSLFRVSNDDDDDITRKTRAHLEAAQNVMRAIGLLQAAIKMKQSATDIVNAMIARDQSNFYEALATGQVYCEAMQGARANLALALQRIRYQGDLSNVQLLLEAGDDGGGSVSTQTALLDYIYSKFRSVAWDMDKVIAALDHDRDRRHNVDILAWFHQHCNRKEMIEALAVTWQSTVRELAEVALSTGNTGKAADCLASWIEWIERHWPLFAASQTFRVSTINAVLATMARCADRYRGRRPVFCANALLSASHRIRKDEMVLIEDALAVLWSAVDPLGLVDDDRVNLLTTIVAKPGQPIRRARTDPAPVQQPVERIDEMTLAQLCHAMLNPVYADYNAAHLDEYVAAVSHQFAQCVNSLADDIVTDAPDVVLHRPLRELSKLLRAYSKVEKRRPLPVLTDAMTTQYATLLAIFVEPIELSLEGLCAVCPCCAMTYRQCVAEIGSDISELVALGAELASQVNQLCLLVQLPSLEQNILPWYASAIANDDDDDEQAYASPYALNGLDLHASDDDDDDDLTYYVPSGDEVSDDDIKYDEEGYVLQ